TAPAADRLFLRRDDPRVRPDVELCEPGSSRGSLGHCCLLARPATLAARRGRRARGVGSGKARRRRSVEAGCPRSFGKEARWRNSVSEHHREEETLPLLDTYIPPAADLDRLGRTVLVVGGVAALATIALAFTNPAQFFQSYLVGYIWVFGV